MLSLRADCQDDDAADNEDDQGGFNDLYDMDDEFIDDTELQDYFGSDRRKTKFSGFFINKVSCKSHVYPAKLACPLRP